VSDGELRWCRVRCRVRCRESGGELRRCRVMCRVRCTEGVEGGGVGGVGRADSDMGQLVLCFL